MSDKATEGVATGSVEVEECGEQRKVELGRGWLRVYKCKLAPGHDGYHECGSVSWPAAPVPVRASPPPDELDDALINVARDYPATAASIRERLAALQAVYDEAWRHMFTPHDGCADDRLSEALRAATPAPEPGVTAERLREAHGVWGHSDPITADVMHAISCAAIHGEADLPDDESIAGGAPARPVPGPEPEETP